MSKKKDLSVEHKLVTVPCATSNQTISTMPSLFMSAKSGYLRRLDIAGPGGSFHEHWLIHERPH